MNSESLTSAASDTEPDVECNASFIQKMTSKASGLLPQFISKWFGSPTDGEDGHRGVRALPETDSSADEDEDNASSRPPAKRMRLDYTDRLGNHTTSCQTQTELIRTVETSNSTYESIRELTGPSDYRLQLQSSSSTPLYSGRTSNCVPTTSRDLGSIARMPAVRSQETSVPAQSIFSRNPEYKTPFVDSTKNEVAEVSVIKNTQIKTPSRPYFKPALVGSPFYPGRTMYGGAYNTTSYLSKSPVYNPRKLTVQPAQSTANTTMSQTAKRIFDLLEDYSSPMKDAKRIPVMNSTPLAVRRTDSEDSLDSASDTNLVRSLKINRMRDLNPPSIPALLRMKRNNRLMDTTQEARWIAASHSSSLHMSTPYMKKQPAKKSDESDFQGKLKTRVTRREPVSSDPSAAPPPAVTFANAALSIGSSDLPTFSFSTPKSKEPLASGRVSADKAADKLPPQETLKTAKESNEFQFSNPIDVLSTDGKKSDASLCPRTSSFPSIPNNISSWSDKLNQQHGWQCKKCWSSNKIEAKTCVSCGTTDLAKDDESPKSKPARKSPETFSDRFAKRKSSEPVQAPSEKKMDTGFSDILKQQQKQWECASCLTRNDADKPKCVCCECKKPGAAPSKGPPPGEAKSGFQDIINQQKQQWECSSCLTRNKAESAKCACCESPKPGGSASVKATAEKTGAPDAGFADLIEQQNKRWECAACMTRNEDNRLKCACCESAKPGAPKPEAAVGIKFDFKKTPDTSFKFGIDKADLSSVDKTDSKLENISNNNVPSVTNENKPPPTGFTFSKPIDKPLTNCDSPPNVKRSLMFHTNNGELGKTSPAMTFKLPEKPVVTNPETSKAPELPVFGASSIKPVGMPTFTFGAPKSLASTTSTPNATSLFTAPDAKFSTPAPSLGASTAFGGIQSLTSTGHSVASTGQSLTAPGQSLTAHGQSLTTPGQTLTGLGQSLTVPGQTLTAPGQTLTAPSQTFTAPSQTLTAPSQSLFGIPSSTETNKMSPLQVQPKSDKPATLGGATPSPLFSAVPATTASTNPVFSFGSGSTPLAATTKPGGFNFSFSSNKTEATPTFNAEPVLFGAPATKEATPTFKAPSLNAEPVLFGAPVTKEATPTFSASSSQSDQLVFGAPATTGLVNSSNLLGSSSIKSPALTFGSTQPKNMFTSPSQAADSTTTFGGSSQLKSGSFFGAKTSTFGETKSPLFGSPIPSFTSNETKPAVFGSGALFGMSNQNATPSQPAQSQPLMFGAPPQSQQTTNHFGGPSQTQTAASLPGSSGLFNNPLSGSITPTFGASSGLPQFGDPAPQQNLAQPAFNFGSASTPAPSFTFGQSSQTNSQPFSFCASPIPTNPSLQFNIGTSPMSQNTTAPQRRVRKAIRRTNMPR